MSDADWYRRWEAGQIGFHVPVVNPLLCKHWSEIDAGQRVFVPLCGKTLDLSWLAERGHDVVGVELVEQAVTEFFAEAGLTPTVDDVAGGRRYRHGAITIYAADIFALDDGELGRFDCVYDRAALIALPAGVRPRYVRRLLDVLRPGATGLLVSFDYDQSRMQGPPYSVPAAEFKSLFGNAVQWRCLAADGDALAHNAKFAERGLESLTESVWSLQVADDGRTEKK
ncbi:MAG: thiopurine S-methyltransferase [Pseudomonadota bacterium]